MPWMPIWKVMIPRLGELRSPRYGRTPAPGTLSSAGYFPARSWHAEDAIKAGLACVRPTFCRLT